MSDINSDPDILDLDELPSYISSVPEETKLPFSLDIDCGHFMLLFIK